MKIRKPRIKSAAKETGKGTGAAKPKTKQVGTKQKDPGGAAGAGAKPKTTIIKKSTTGK